MAQACREFRVSSDARDDVPELKKRLAEEGYLFFRKLVDPDKVMDLRRDITRVLREVGWLVADADPMDGIADVSARCTEGDLPYNTSYHKVYKLESFHRLPHDPALVGMVEKLIGRRAIPLPGHKARIWFPKFTEHTTPLHQDFVHYQGSLQALTCWMPVGDCPVPLGPLAVLPGSHKVKKVLSHHFSLGAGGLIIDLDEQIKAHPELNVPWLTTDFGAGDVLFFPALTIHRALPNVTEDRMRVSLDNRYEGEGDNIAAHMLTPHMTDILPISWEEVYKDWKSDDLKYYWKKIPHRAIPKYEGYSKKGFAEALELARAKDKRAILALRRAVRNCPTSEDARAAKIVLEEIGVAQP